MLYVHGIQDVQRGCEVGSSAYGVTILLRHGRLMLGVFFDLYFGFHFVFLSCKNCSDVEFVCILYGINFAFVYYTLLVVRSSVDELPIWVSLSYYY